MSADLSLLSYTSTYEGIVTQLIVIFKFVKIHF